MNGFERLLPFLAPVFVVGFWLLLMRLIASLSGWRRLAERFAYSGEFRGTLHKGQSARMNGANLNGILDLGVGEEGLYLSLMVLFRPSHAPLLIPWGEVRSEPVQRLLFRGRKLTFMSCPGVSLELSEKTFGKIAAAGHPV